MATQNPPSPRRSPFLPDPADQVFLTSSKKVTNKHSTSKKPLGAESLFPPTNDLFKLGSRRPPSKKSGRIESDDEESGTEDENGDSAATKSKTSHDPLSTQVWRLFSMAKDSAPNGQRLENLTWRMMAMAIQRKDPMSERRRSFSESAPINAAPGTVIGAVVTSRDSPSPMDTASGQAASESQRTMKNNGPWLSNDRDTLQIDSEQPQIVPGAIFAQVDPDNIPEQPQLQQESPMTLDNILPTLSTMTDFALYQPRQDSQLATPVASFPSSGATFALQASIPATLTCNDPSPIYTPGSVTPQLYQQPQQQLLQEQWLLQAMSDMSALDSVIGDTGGQKSTASPFCTNVDQLSPLLPIAWQQGQQHPQGYHDTSSFNPLESAFTDQILTQASTSAYTGQVPADVPPWQKNVHQGLSEWWQGPNLTDTTEKLPYEALSSLFDFQAPPQQPQDFMVPLSSTSSDSDTEDEDFVPITTAKATLAPSITKDSTSVPPTQCTHCGTKTTPLWRRNQNGNTLCNACGLFQKLHGRARPLSLKTDVIRKRNRVGLNSKSAASTATGSTAATSSVAVTAKSKQKKDKDGRNEAIAGGHGTKRCHHEDRDDNRSDTKDPHRSGDIMKTLPSSLPPTAPVHMPSVRDNTTSPDCQSPSPLGTGVSSTSDPSGPAIGYFFPSSHSSSKRRRRHSGTNDMNVHNNGSYSTREMEHLRPRGSISLSIGNLLPEEILTMVSAPLSAPIDHPSLSLLSGSSVSSFMPDLYNSELYRMLQYLDRQQQQQQQQQRQQQQQQEQQLGLIQEPDNWIASLLFPQPPIQDQRLQQPPIMTTTNMYSKVAAPLSDRTAEGVNLGWPYLTSVNSIATHSFLDTRPQTPLESQLDQLGVSMDLFNDLLGQL